MKPRYALIGLLCLLLTSSAFGAVYTASDAPGPGEFATIQDAVNMCSPTDSVEVIGAFTENVVITASPAGTSNITIFNGGGAYIDAGAGVGIQIGSGICGPTSGDYVTIDGLEISYGGGNAINLPGSCPTRFVTIKNCYIHRNVSGFASYGLNVSLGGSGHTITDNCFHDNTGFHAYDINTTPGDNTYSRNSFEDFQTNSGYGVGEYWIPGGAQKDLSPAAAKVTPTAPAELLYGSEVAYPLDFTFDAPCLGLRGAKVIEFDVTWNPGKLDYVRYENGDGMPGQGEYLINDDDVATGKLVVTAASLDDEMFEDGNLGFISFDVIGIPNPHGTPIWTAVNTACLAFSSAGDTIPMAPVTGVGVQIVDNGDPTIAYTVNNPFANDTYQNISDIDILTCDVTDDVDLYAAWYRIEPSATWVAFADLLNTGNPPPFVTSDALEATVTPPYVYHATGDYTMEFRVDDHFGNSTVVEYPFSIDRTAPVLSAFSVVDRDGCAQAGYTDGAVSVKTTGDGTADQINIRYILSGDPTWSETGWTTYYATKNNVDLTGLVDGLYYFDVDVKDIYGNATGWSAHQTIDLFQVDCGPVGFAVDAKSSDTTLTGEAQTDWSLTSFSCPGTFYGFKLTETLAEAQECSDFNTTAAYSGTFTFSDNTQGERKVYLSVVDLYGNIKVDSATTVIDFAGPVISWAKVLDKTDLGTSCTNDLSTWVVVKWHGDVNDVDAWIYLNEVQGSLPGPTWFNVGAPGDAAWHIDTLKTFAFGYTVPDDYTVFARARDDMFNYSNDKSNGIWIDGINPTLSQVYLRDLDYPADGDGIPVDAQWSNSTTVDIFFPGVVETGDFDFVISEVGDFSDEVLVNKDDATDLGSGLWVVEFPLAATIADGGSTTPMCKIRDCSGRESAFYSDAIGFDFMSRDAASVAGFDAVSATVNYLTPVLFNVNASDAVSGVWKMKIFEVGNESASSWETFATVAGVTLQNLGDGERTVGIKVDDRAGNVTYGEATVIVDTEGPAGSFHIVSSNPDAYAGMPHAYTNTSNCKLLIDVPSDCVQLAIRDWDKGGPAWTAWSYMVPTAPGSMETVSPHYIDFGVNMAFDTVEVAFEDAAHNWEYVIGHIFVDAPSTSPPAFACLADEGVYFGDGTDCGVWWDNDYPDHYFSRAYYLRRGNYPVYEGAMVPQPTDVPGNGFPITFDSRAEIPEGWNGFLQTDDPTEDIYRFSVYNVDSAGNKTINTPGMAMSQSYIVGDLDFDGFVSHTDSRDAGAGDFIRFSNAYYALDNQIPADPYWDDACDFSDNLDTYPYPEPDDACNIYDLFDFVISYTNYHDGVGSRGSEKFFSVAMDPGGAKFAPTHAPVAIMAELPDRLAIGEEVTIAFNLDDPSGIMGLHMVFNLSDNLEIVKVEKGEMFTATNEKTFFYKDIGNGNLLIDGVVFSENGFAKQEIAQVTFQAKANIAAFTLDNVDMLVRDANNQAVEAVFNTTVEKTVVLPTKFSLGQNYPNPFNPSTSIELALPVASHYVLDIYNIAGQKVETFSGYSEAGIVNVIWEASDAASGVYFYKVNAGTFEATKKMVLLK